MRPYSSHLLGLLLKSGLQPLARYGTHNNDNNNNPVGTIPPQQIVVWEFVAPTYGYEEIGMKCAGISLT